MNNNSKKWEWEPYLDYYNHPDKVDFPKVANSVRLYDKYDGIRAVSNSDTKKRNKAFKDFYDSLDNREKIRILKKIDPLYQYDSENNKILYPDKRHFNKKSNKFITDLFNTKNYSLTEDDEFMSQFEPYTEYEQVGGGYWDPPDYALTAFEAPELYKDQIEDYIKEKNIVDEIPFKEDALQSISKPIIETNKFKNYLLKQLEGVVPKRKGSFEDFLTSKLYKDDEMDPNLISELTDKILKATKEYWDDYWEDAKEQYK